MKTKVQQFIEGIGGVRFWGFSPAIDLNQIPHPSGQKGDIDALFMQPGDAGSVLYTMARLRRQEESQKVNVYLLEKQPEVLARHILLISIILDDDLGPRECTEIFLEVYGNMMLRKQTSAYIQGKIEELIKFLTNEEGKLAKIIDVSLLKFKQRDAIEKVFKSWHEDIECDMEAWREKRCRTYFEDRFDYRKNLIDWDYSMGIKEWAEIIHTKLYTFWRMHGLAYEIRDSRYPQPNRTLAAYAEGKEKGFSKLKRGFWGDIVQSPYWSFGVVADEERLFKKRSYQHVKCCQHVAEYNVYGIIHELKTGSPYRMPKEDEEIYGRSFWGGVSHRDTSEKLSEISEEGDEEEETDRLDTLNIKQAGGSSTKEPPQGFKIYLLEGDDATVLQGKKRFNNLFNFVFVSNLLTATIKSAMTDLLQDKSWVICENSDFMLNFHKDERKSFEERIVQIGHGIGCEPSPGVREKLTTHTGKMYPLQFLRYDRSKAAGIIAEKGPKEKEILETVSESALEQTLANSTLDDRPTDDQAAEQADSNNAPLPDDAEIPSISGPAATKKEPAKQVQGPFGICVITGLPAKYKDPVTGQPYANVEAFKELRKRHQGEEAEGQGEEANRASMDSEVAEQPAENEAEGAEQGGDEDDEEVEPLFTQTRPKWGIGGNAVV